LTLVSGKVEFIVILSGTAAVIARCLAAILEDGSSHIGQKFLLCGSEPKASAEPPRVPCPAGPDFGDQPFLSPEGDPDATGNGSCLLPAGQEVIVGVPAAIPDLDIGDQQLLTIDVQGIPGSYPFSVIRIACRQTVIDTCFFIDSVRYSAIEKS